MSESAALSRISVIVPTRNEAAGLAATLAAVRRERPYELIVVDGASEDETASIASAFATCVLSAPPGRGGQLNRGAAAATGDVLLFLHADTLLPPGAVRDVEAALSPPGVVAGAFLLGIDGDEASFRWIERLVACRSRRLSLPYGDQAIFLRRSTFEAVGGFPEQPVAEDLALMRRLRRRGRIAIVERAVRTSPRRWRAVGIWRATAVNLLSVLAYQLGVSPAWIHRWRQRVTGKSRGEAPASPTVSPSRS